MIKLLAPYLEELRGKVRSYLSLSEGLGLIASGRIGSSTVSLARLDKGNC